MSHSRKRSVSPSRPESSSKRFKPATDEPKTTNPLALERRGSIYEYDYKELICESTFA